MTSTKDFAGHPALRYADAVEAVSALLARHPAEHAALDDPGGVAALLRAFRDAGAEGAVLTLAARAASDVVLDYSESVAGMLGELRYTGPDEVAFTIDRGGVAGLLGALRDAGAEDAVLMLAARAVNGVAIDDPFGVARLLASLREVGAVEAVSALLARHPAEHAALDDISGFGRWTVVMADQVAGVPALLRALRDAGAEDAVLTLAARAANNSALDDPRVVIGLLGELHYVQADEAATTLAVRAAEGVALDNRKGVAGLLKALRYAEAEDAASTLIARAANAGLWELSLNADPIKARQYKFGRQPDGTASTRWDWQDLFSRECSA
ncbi:MAG: hypothetical protein ACRDN0_13790 [Trebonia sp.]